MKIAKWSAAPILVALVACLGCAVSVDGGAAADLEYVDTATFADRTVFLNPLLSHRPVLEATEGAHRVRMEFYESFVVAWDEVDGQAVYGRDRIRAVWRVLDGASPAHVLNGSVEPGTGDPPEQYGPAPSASVGTLVDPDAYGVLPAAAAPVAAGLGSPSISGLVLVDWRARLDEQREMLGVVERLGAAHPGCI